MKISKRQLSRIIKEEKQRLFEQPWEQDPETGTDDEAEFGNLQIIERQLVDVAARLASMKFWDAHGLVDEALEVFRAQEPALAPPEDEPFQGYE